MAYEATAPRAILHVDADCFFLAVHAREAGDASLLGSTVPTVLWQYNDVICASHAARRRGVRKHLTPEQAKALIQPDGRLVHAYWREWPGPRIWYGRYNAASRELFDSLHAALQAALAGLAPASALVVQRASIDEAYIDECLDASGIGVFHLVTIPACGLAAMSQSLQTNLLSFLQPCAGAAFHVPVASSEEHPNPVARPSLRMRCDRLKFVLLSA